MATRSFRTASLATVGLAAAGLLALQGASPASAAVSAQGSASASTAALAGSVSNQAPTVVPGMLPTSPEPTAVVQSRVAAQEFITTALQQQAAMAAAIAAAQWHVPVGNYNISSYFGELRGGYTHAGLDFAGPQGQPIMAAKSGTVTEAGYNGGYGYVVTIDHGNGLQTRYGHLMSQPSVTVGQAVNAGDAIGQLGSTGDSTGPHLHFEVIDGGQKVDPMAYFTIPTSV